MEIWKPLVNFPDYNGSSEGRIKNIKTQRILRPAIDRDGKAKVTLRKDNVQYSAKVHRVIAEAFLGDHPGMDVRHKDRNRSNNRVDNLEWCTRSELIADAYRRGTKKPYQSIPIKVLETSTVYASILECARDLCCDKAQISKYLAGKCKHVKGYHFEVQNSHR